jgi:hypothetical protein
MGNSNFGSGFSLSPSTTNDFGQFIGVRFHTVEWIAVDHIGGNLFAPEGSLGDRSLFGAIVSLSGPAALPSGDPTSFVPLAHVTFVPTVESGDIRIPLSATLAPGDYALIFGSGLFGASGYGIMPNNNSDNPGVSYFTGFPYPGGSGGYWQQNAGISDVRFVVMAIVVPEPSVISLLGSVVAGVIFCCWRFRGPRASASQLR